MKKIAITLFFLSLFLPLFGENDYKDCVTPLYQACKDNNRIKIDLLLSKGADINQKNPSCDERWDFSGETPLYAAIDQRNTDLAKYLIKRGARLDISTVNSGTPLHKAARSGNSELIQLLLDQGVDVNANLYDADELPGYGGTGLALHMATDQALYDLDKNYHNEYKNLIQTIKIMVEKGADLNAVRNEDGKTVLYMAIEERDPDLARYFIEKGADVNIATHEGTTPLILCCYLSDWEMIELLLQKGADTEMTDLKRSYTALAWAYYYDNRKAIDILEKYHAQKKHPSVSIAIKLRKAEAWEDFTDNLSRFFLYTGIPLLYTGLSIYLFESHFKNNPSANWMGSFNAYTLGIGVTGILGAVLAAELWPKSQGFLGELNKLNGLLWGGIGGAALGIILVRALDLPRHFQENRGLYYLTPAISLSIPIIIYSLEF